MPKTQRTLPPIADNLRNSMRARNLDTRTIMKQLPNQSTRWALYRLLKGTSTDVRIGTLLDVCAAGNIPITELVGYGIQTEGAAVATQLVRIRSRLVDLLGLVEQAESDNFDQTAAAEYDCEGRAAGDTIGDLIAPSHEAVAP